MTRSDLLEWLEDRERTYRFLAQAFRAEPTPDFVANLVAALADGQEDGESAGYALLRRWAAAVPAAGVQAAHGAVELEYARLFFAPAGTGHVAPYESAYTSPDKMLMQEAAHEVVAAYREAGLAWRPESRAYPDHLSVELEFMAGLCAEAQDAASAGQEAVARRYLEMQWAFLSDHLLRWAPQFAADLERATRSDLLRGLALITSEFLADEPADVNEAIGSPA